MLSPPSNIPPKRFRDSDIKANALTAAQIDTLAQRRSCAPFKLTISAKKAGENLAYLLAPRSSAERAALPSLR